MFKVKFSRSMVAVPFLSVVMLYGCRELGDLTPHDTASLLLPEFKRSEVFGFVAGFGTTFAAVPDLVAMLRRRSSEGMNPTMAAIMGIFQILWVYYGLLTASRPVIAWNIVAILINSSALELISISHAKKRAEKLMPDAMGASCYWRRIAF
jgi:MtN3 and saliva related transmembrane protein